MKNILSLTILIAIFASCQKDSIIHEVRPENIQAQEALQDVLKKKMIIGRQLPNPYSLSIMRKAAANLNIATKSDNIDDLICATHHYVVFKPSCHAHYRSLIMDDELDINPFPLDHEISDGWVVVDPKYSVNGYQHKWAYVPVDKDLSQIDCPYEILYDIYSPDSVDTKSTFLTDDDFMLLQEEAHRLCGLDLFKIPETKASHVIPSGNIKYWDSTLGKYIGCYGMSIKASRLTKTSYGHCDDDGNFTCDKSFQYNWKYTVFFGRTDFETRRDTTETEPVSLVFSDCSGPLNLQFSNGSSFEDCIFYCEILRAACKYFYGTIDGLRRPPFKDELKDRIYIQAMRGSCPTGDNTLAFFRYFSTHNSKPMIRIYRNNPGGGRQSSSSIYGSTIHELAHSAHWNYNPSFFYNSCDKKVKESFARGIQWYLTKKVYTNYSIGYDSTYTGLVQDLIDNDGFKAGSASVVENVSGFSIAEIEQSVLGMGTWASWKNNIKSKYPYNSTIGNIDALYSLW